MWQWPEPWQGTVSVRVPHPEGKERWSLGGYTSPRRRPRRTRERRSLIRELIRELMRALVYLLYEEALSPNQVPMRYPGSPHTDDAYAVGATPIQVDLRVPMFGSLDPLSDGSTVDQALYCASLSSPDLNIHLRSSNWTATGHYRGEQYRAHTGGASMSALLRSLALQARKIDEKIGGIRVEEEIDLIVVVEEAA